MARKMVTRSPKIDYFLTVLATTGVSLASVIALPAVTSPAIADDWYNCLTREVWSPEKQAWCAKLQTLENLEYTLPNYGTVPLQRGQYENREQRFTVALANRPNWLDFGDLNGDQVEDAAVLLAVNSGGSGQFTYLVPVLDVGGEAQPLTPVLLGDRIRMNRLEISGGIVMTNLMTQGPNDPLCCPTQEVTWRYALQPTLVPLEGGNTSTLPAPLPQNPSDQSTTTMPTAEAAVTGTVTYRPRIALPPGARVEISLQDVSRADAPAEIIASQTMVLEGEQVPVAFSLPYDPAQIEETHTYAVRASIYVEDQLRFTTTRRYGVITQDSPTTIEVIVDPVR